MVLWGSVIALLASVAGLVTLGSIRIVGDLAALTFVISPVHPDLRDRGSELTSTPIRRGRIAALQLAHRPESLSRVWRGVGPAYPGDYLARQRSGPKQMRVTSIDHAYVAKQDR